jgi:hypothetical protein
MFKIGFYLSVAIFQLIGLMSCGQTTMKNCGLYIESIESNDTLLIICSVTRERVKEIETVSVYRNKGELIARLNWNFGKNDTTVILSDTIIIKIKTFERALRNQSLAGNEIQLAGSVSAYELIFKQGKISYSTKNSYYSLCEELLK